MYKIIICNLRIGGFTLLYYFIYSKCHITHIGRGEESGQALINHNASAINLNMI